MTSLIKCAKCGRKPTVKPSAERAPEGAAVGGPRDTGAAKQRPTEADTQKRLADTFKQFDKNGDGSISKAELKEVLLAISRKGGKATIPDEDIERLLAVVDVNGDGCVDYEEFVAWVTTPGDGADVLQRMRAAPKPLRGPERFFYDKTTYTGVHTAGGPSTLGGGSEGQCNDLSEITRPGSRSQGTEGRPVRASTASRAAAPAEAAAAQDSAARPQQPTGPERFFYDKSSYTGTHKNGGPESVAKGAGTHADQSRKREDPSSLPSLTSKARPTSSGRGRPTTPAAPSEATSQDPAPAQQPTGPERFFYDKSSYTGTHKNGGPESVPKGAGTHADQALKREDPGARARPTSASRGRPTTPARNTHVEAAAQDSAAKRAKSPRQAAGPERFFYDKSSYTGTHKNGGPESVAKGTGSHVDQTWKREH